MSNTLSQSELLILYDRDERFRAVFPGSRREEAGDVVRQVDLVENSGTIMYSRLDELSAEAAIREQMAYFGGLGRDFEWKAYAHDRPPDLIRRLAHAGFEIDEPEAILVLDLEARPEASLARAPIQVKRIERPDELEPIASIKQQLGAEHHPDHRRRLELELELDPTYVSVYLAYLDDAPAACGWVRFPRGSAFASLWGGSTVPALRGQGLYTALLEARVREARERGARYITVDARSMSRPILERRGFKRLTTATACTFQASSVRQ